MAKKKRQKDRHSEKHKGCRQIACSLYNVLDDQVQGLEAWLLAGLSLPKA